MFLINEYTLIRQRQEDMLRQAEHERLLQAMKPGVQLHKVLIVWFGTHLVKWGQKLEMFGTLKQMPSSNGADF